MLTILSRRKKKRRSTFSENYSEDPTWKLADRMSAKAKIKKLSVEELVEKTKTDYEQMEEIDFELDEHNEESKDDQ